MPCHNGSGADLLFQQRQNALEEAKEATKGKRLRRKQLCRRSEQRRRTPRLTLVSVTCAFDGRERDMMRRTCFEIENCLLHQQRLCPTDKGVMPLEMELAEVKQMGSEAGGDLFSTRQRVKELEREVTETRR